MNNKYLKNVLDLAFRQYQLLKEDKKYRAQWEKLKTLECQCRSAKTDNERFKALLLLVDLKLKMKEEWPLQSLISPDLKLIKEDLYKRVRPGSSLAQFIHAFGVDTNPAILSRKPVVKKVSERTRARDIRIKKYFCYFMVKLKKLWTISQAARIFDVDKNTIRNWLKDVKYWDEGERNAVAREMLSRKITSDKDMFDIPGKVIHPKY